MLEALAKVRAEFGKEYPIVIGGEKIKSGDVLKSYNPSNKEDVVGMVQKGTPELAQKAISAAWDAFESWRRVSAKERAGYLLKAAELVRQRRFELAALMVYETGKNWTEASADVAEAIDFLEFYSREAIRWANPQPVIASPGETNELVYVPLGVGAIIPPWNFPVAILVGMTSSAIVAGNTVVLKPASDACILGAKFCEIMEEAGLPPGVLNLLPGSGSEVGEYLVTNSDIRFISFTGSKQVGLRIIQNAAKTQLGQKWTKRVVAEMGGKNAIIVDSEADVENAVQGIIASAYGYQGQKCSACSRAIVVKDVYDEVIMALRDKTKRIKIGPAENFDNYMGPVINQAAYEKISRYIEVGRNEGELILGGDGDNSKGYFIKPTIFTHVSCDARIAQEEIFGPVLAVIKAEDFDEALTIANGTDYGLTGSVYTTNPEKIKKAKEQFFVGNLYLNRKCTGALVGAQPFGGFNMSGTDSKAGGKEYLLLFIQAKSICERK